MREHQDPWIFVLRFICFYFLQKIIIIILFVQFQTWRRHCSRRRNGMHWMPRVTPISSQSWAMTEWDRVRQKEIQTEIENRKIPKSIIIFLVYLIDWSRRETASTQTVQRWHARIIPAARTASHHLDSTTIERRTTRLKMERNDECDELVLDRFSEKFKTQKKLTRASNFRFDSVVMSR